MSKLTAPQVLGLRFYARLALPREERRQYPKVLCPDPRVETKLLGLGLLGFVWEEYPDKPAYRRVFITEAGQEALKK